jgi:hypothetical protein
VLIDFLRLSNHRTFIFNVRCKKTSYDLNTSFGSSNNRKNNNFGHEIRFAKMEMEIRRHSLSPSPGSYDLKDSFKVSKIN